MIAIVVVSHSDPLARAAVDLALQMVADDPPPIEVAAGANGGLGTDATAVAAALERADAASDGTGVLVITDLGSALLSAEMALEFADGLRGEVLLSRAPFVEGLVAAAVRAALGGSLAQVEREAAGALRAKAAQLGPADDSPGEAAAGPGPADGSSGSQRRMDGPPQADGGGPTGGSPGEERGEGEVSVEVSVVNPQGLHARPAALFAKAAADLPVEVTVTNLDNGQGPGDADSMIELMALGVRLGHRIRLTASGSGAQEALRSLAELVSSGLGEA